METPFPGGALVIVYVEILEQSELGLLRLLVSWDQLYFYV